MEIDLNELERRANAATPGKWTWKQVGSFNAPGCAVFWPDTSKGGVHYRRLDSGGGMLEADANFVAAANPAVVLELVRRLRDAEARVAAAAMAAYGEACKGTHPALSAEISAEYPQFFPRWPNHAAAMTDRIFHEARGIMGTENYGQEEALRMAILHVMRAYSGSKGD